MLAGLGVASAAAITALTPGSAKAHWGGWGGGGWGGWGGCNDPEDVVYGLLGALEMFDAEELAEWLHQDVVYSNAGLHDIVGRDAVAQSLGSYQQVFEPLEVDVVSIATHGNRVCTERVERFAVRLDSPIGTPGAELYLKVAGWYEVHHGKVIRWADYWDTQIFTTTLGIPMPSA